MQNEGGREGGRERERESERERERERARERASERPAEEACIMRWERSRSITAYMAVSLMSVGPPPPPSPPMTHPVVCTNEDCACITPTITYLLY